MPLNWHESEARAYDEPIEFQRRMPLARAWPFENELDPSYYAYDEELLDEDDDFVEARGVPIRSTRGVAVRVLGFLVIAAALLGCGKVLTHPRAIHEALSWATLGQVDRILGVTQKTSTPESDAR